MDGVANNSITFTAPKSMRFSPEKPVGAAESETFITHDFKGAKFGEGETLVLTTTSDQSITVTKTAMLAELNKGRAEEVTDADLLDAIADSTGNFSTVTA